MKKIQNNSPALMLHHWREAVPDDRLAHLIRDVSRAQMRSLHGRLSQHGVAFGHWQFLRILWTKDGLTQRELSDLAGVMEPTTFSAMKMMEGAGFIERKELAGNKKNKYVFLTKQGRALKAKLVPLAEDVNQMSIAGLSDATLATVRKALVTIIENLAKEEEDKQKASAEESA
jgi:MarR family transcriptional regulator, organic hydroperoxide resistance regulator